MGLFRRKHKEEEELEEDEEEDKKFPAKRKFRDLNPENRQKRKVPPKPWGKKERLLIFFVFFVMAVTSAVLAASARSWKLPGMKQIEVPKLQFEQEYELEKEPTVLSHNLDEIFESEMQSITTSLSGIYAVYALNLRSGELIAVNETEIMQAASLIKLPTMAAVLKEAELGRVDLDEKYRLKASDKVGGSGSLYYKAEGTPVTYEQLVELMGQQSDNTAFAIVRNQLGDKLINSYIDQFGLNDTSLEENLTTVSDIGRFFKLLWEGRILEQDSKGQLLKYLTNTIYEDWIPASIPVEDGTTVAHKYGREVHVINDAGIVQGSEPFILVIMTKGIIDKEAEVAFPQIVQLTYRLMTQGY